MKKLLSTAKLASKTLPIALSVFVLFGAALSLSAAASPLQGHRRREVATISPRVTLHCLWQRASCTTLTPRCLQSASMSSELGRQPRSGTTMCSLRLSSKAISFSRQQALERLALILNSDWISSKLTIQITGRRLARPSRPSYRQKPLPARAIPGCR